MRHAILEYLRESEGEFVSGQHLSNKLNVSRTAVWKHIKALKERGYLIEAYTRKGYRLVGSPDLLAPTEILDGLETRAFGHNIQYVEKTESTNVLAKIAASLGALEGTIVVAEEQVAGHGRLSRGWYSPFAKGVWFSIILRPSFLPMEASKMTLLAAVALTKAFHRLGLTNCGIKWPNDILVNGRKLVGILTELDATMEEINYIVMGMGINVTQKKAEFPKELKKIATSFWAENVMVGRKEILQNVLLELERSCDVVQREGFEPILKEWKTLSVTLNKYVNVIAPDKTFTGKAIDLDQDGNLLVQTENGVERVMAGDVSIRPAK